MMMSPPPATGVAATTTTTTTTLPQSQPRVREHDLFHTLAGVIGNVLEWYDFAVFGYFSDVIGEVFFPPSSGHTNTMEAFLVYGMAFLMRPVGGVLMGYVGDVYGRKTALIYSIFLMAVPTFTMGCLPGYDSIGALAIVLLVIVRCLQGLSVGGQLMSSLVYTLEGHDRRKWGLYGSYVMAASNFGTMLGGLMATALKANLNDGQLERYGWRIPFWSGIVVSFAGFYLRSSDDEADIFDRAMHNPVPDADYDAGGSNNDDDHDHDNRNDYIAASSPESPNSTKAIVMTSSSSSSSSHTNPLRLAFARDNLRSLFAACLVPMLWAAGFYLSFVWMAIYMDDLIEPPLEHSFTINTMALFLSVCLLFPVGGTLSDRYGRKRVMSIGGFVLGVFGPVAVHAIGRGHPFVAFCCQCLLGVGLSLFGAPMCAWLVESFEPRKRLTSVAIGYNIAHATVAGSSPAIATAMVDNVSSDSPGYLYTILAIVSMTGLWFVAPSIPAAGAMEAEEEARRRHGNATTAAETLDTIFRDMDGSDSNAAGETEMTTTTTKKNGVTPVDLEGEGHRHVSAVEII